MEKDELIFVLNTSELTEAGFEGSFNDFAEELENAGANVSGEYDEDGNPVMTVYGIDVEELNSLLSDYGVDSPEDFTTEVESASDFDFDTQNESDSEDGDDDNLPEIEDDEDEDIVIEDDEDNEDEDFGDADDADETFESRLSTPNRMRHRRMHESHKTVNKVWKGTANLSESVTMNILNQVKDNAMMNRILKGMNEAQKVRVYNPPLPYSGIMVNGKEMIMMSESELVKTLSEAKTSYRKYYSKYKSLNESQDVNKSKYAKVLTKQSKLIGLLENVIALKTGKLNEDEAFGTTESNNDESTEKTATLTAITFKVKNADNFIKVLTDNGIPENVLEKVAKEENTSSDNTKSETPAQEPAQMDANAGGDMGGMNTPAGDNGMGGGNPFESVTSRLTKNQKLNEDETNPFGDPDQPASDSGVDPLNTESHDNNDEGEEVRLTDTSYAAKVQEIIAKVYNFSKEKFDKKIGGQIVGTDDGSDEENGFDENGNQTEDDAKTVGEEETINPADVFDGIDI